MYFWEKHRGYQDRPMMITEQGKTFRYGEVYDWQERFLRELPPRSLVFFAGGNRAADLSVYLGLLRMEHVPLMLPETLGQKQKSHLIERYQPNALIDGRQKKIRMLHTGRVPMHPDLALLLLTSGSTGSPKAVRLSYRNLQSNAESIAEYLEITENDRAVTMLPLYYTYGLSVIHSHVQKGACLLVTERSILEQRFWEFLKRAGATSLAGVPYTYELFYRFHLENIRIPSLRTITQAGGHLSKELQQYMAEWTRNRGIRFYVMYGQTEATARMAYLPWEKCLEKPGSIGKAIPGGKLELADEAGGTVTGAGQEGELVYRGPNVSMGYAENREDLQLGDCRHQILHTGDLARRDAEGYFYITGRLARFVKLFGKRVSLDRVEQMIAEHWSGVSCACTGNDRGILLCMEQDVRCPAPEAVRNYLEDEAGIPGKAVRILPVCRIPRKENGKPDYTRLEALRAEGKTGQSFQNHDKKM
jgi:long-chain acyl-CoA synthetase